MCPSTSTTTLDVLHPRPLTSNTLPVEQRAKLIRSTRKVGDILGETPRLVEDEDEHAPLPKPTRTRAIPSALSREAFFTPLPSLDEVFTPKTPTPSMRRRQKRRKLAKLQRTFGEVIDPRLVFPSSPITPRGSFASTTLTLVDEPIKEECRASTPFQLPDFSPDIHLPLLIEREKIDHESGWVERPSVDENTRVEIQSSHVEPSPREESHRLSNTRLQLPEEKPNDAEVATNTFVMRSISHRHSKSAVDPSRLQFCVSSTRSPVRASFDEIKRRKSKHRSTSINLAPATQPVDYSNVKFANEGTWNRDDLEEVRKALRGLRAL